MDPANPSAFDEATAGATPIGPAAASGPAPLDHGDVVNLMADLRRRLAASEELAKLTDVQNRLVMQRLEEAGTWERPRAKVEEQLQHIAEAIARVTAMEEERVREELVQCW